MLINYITSWCLCWKSTKPLAIVKTKDLNTSAVEVIKDNQYKLQRMAICGVFSMPYIACYQLADFNAECLIETQKKIKRREGKILSKSTQN